MYNQREESDFITNVLNFDLDDVIEWVQKNSNPEDVFDKEDLEQWALDNGFVEEE